MIAPWPRHQPRHRVAGPDAAGVGEADGGALEVLDGELVVARAAYDVLVGGPERREVHLLGGLDRRHHELAGAVGLLQVDRDAEVDVGRLDEVGLAVLDLEPDVHLGHRLDRLDQRVADQVRERHLAAAGAGEVGVDDDAVVPQQLDRHVAHRGRGRDGQGDVHVLHGAGGRAAEHGVGRLVLGVGLLRRRLLLGDRAGRALGRLGGLGLRARLGLGGRRRGRVDVLGLLLGLGLLRSGFCSGSLRLGLLLRLGLAAGWGCVPAAVPLPAGPPLPWALKYAAHVWSTLEGSAWKRSYISSTSHSLAPNSSGTAVDEDDEGVFSGTARIASSRCADRWVDSGSNVSPPPQKMHHEYRGVQEVRRGDAPESEWTPARRPVLVLPLRGADQ